MTSADRQEVGGDDRHEYDNRQRDSEACVELLIVGAAPLLPVGPAFLESRGDDRLLEHGTILETARCHVCAVVNIGVIERGGGRYRAGGEVAVLNGRLFSRALMFNRQPGVSRPHSQHSRYRRAGARRMRSSCPTVRHLKFNGHTLMSGRRLIDTVPFR
jgi:hypothetical protein